MLRLTRASELKPQAVSWLWPGRLALGSRSLLSGDPGLGKTFLALDWCARLSTGAPMPDGSRNPGPANAIFLSGEDDPKQTIRPRLEALGADLDRVFIPNPGDDFADGPSLPSGWKQLDEAVGTRFRPATGHRSDCGVSRPRHQLEQRRGGKAGAAAAQLPPAPTAANHPLVQPTSQPQPRKWLSVYNEALWTRIY